MSVIMDFEFPSVNRSMIVINLKQPCADWLNQIPDSSDDKQDWSYTLDELNSEPTSYLIPEIFGDEDLEAYIEHSWIILFELQLSGWITDDKLWPKKRSLKMFKEWFDVKCSSIVIDLWGRDPLDYNE